VCEGEKVGGGVRAKNTGAGVVEYVIDREKYADAVTVAGVGSDTELDRNSSSSPAIMTVDDDADPVGPEAVVGGANRPSSSPLIMPPPVDVLFGASGAEKDFNAVCDGGAGPDRLIDGPSSDGASIEGGRSDGGAIRDGGLGGADGGRKNPNSLRSSSLAPTSPARCELGTRKASSAGSGASPPDANGQESVPITAV
jgi:hypothetical protein